MKKSSLKKSVLIIVFLLCLVLASLGVSGATPTTPLDIECNGGTCNISVDASVVLNCSGSTDSDNDEITYVIEATLLNLTTVQNTTNVSMAGVAGVAGEIYIWIEAETFIDDLTTLADGWELCSATSACEEPDEYNLMNKASNYSHVLMAESFVTTPLNFTYDFPTTDTYYLWGRSWQRTGDASARIWNVSIDGSFYSENFFGDIGPGTADWLWEVDAVGKSINAGERLVQIWDGSPDTSWVYPDIILLTTNSSYEPNVSCGNDIDTIGGRYNNSACGLTSGNTTSANETNTTPTTYNDLNSNYSSASKITVKVEIDSYNPLASVQQSTDDPDLYLEIWNSTEWVGIGEFDLNETYIGNTLNKTNTNFSLSTTDSTILAAWQTSANQDIRIKGIYIDYYNATAFDEINYTNIWVTINRTNWNYTGNHTNGSTFSWDTSGLQEQTCIDLRCRATDLITFESLFNISINQSLIDTWQMRYPVTYIFDIPDGSQDIEAYTRNNTVNAWAQISEYNNSDFFNGVQGVRFNYTENKAYVSVGFNNSNTIYLKFNVSGVNYNSKAEYYDNRVMAFTLSNDNWGQDGSAANAGVDCNGVFDNGSCDKYQAASEIARYFNMPITFAINTGTTSTPATAGQSGAEMDQATWDLIQKEINLGGVEVASHTRTHPYSSTHYNENGYEFEIVGSKTDILENLTNFSYTDKVLAYIITSGYEDSDVFSTSADEFLFLRQWKSSNSYIDDWPTWQTNYNYYLGGFAYSAWDDQYFQTTSPDGIYDAGDFNTLKGFFDDVYNSGGVMFAMWHSDRYDNNVINNLADSSLVAILNYSANRKDVWYAANGWLLMYRKVYNGSSITKINNVEYFTKGACLNISHAADNPPTITLDQPPASYINFTLQYLNITFNATVTDDYNLINCSLWHNISGIWALNQSENVSGTSNVTSFNLTDLTNTTFIWNIQCYDNASNYSFASANRSVVLNWINSTPTYAKFNGTTTDFSQYNSTEIQNVSNATVEIIEFGKILFLESANFSLANLDRDVYIKDKLIGINTIAEIRLNKSAQITFYNITYCDPVLYFDGALCSDCVYHSYLGGNLTYNVTHFSNYTVVGNTSLAIWDSVEGTTANVNDTVWFYANYTNGSIHISGATCNITFNDTISAIMTESTNNYNYSRNFSTAGVYIWNVSCNKSGYVSLNVSDDVTISGSSPLNFYFDDFIVNISNNTNISSYVDVEWDGISDYYPIREILGREYPGDAQSVLLAHLNDNVSGASQNIVNDVGTDGTTSGNVNCTVSGKYGTACEFDGDSDYIGFGTISSGSDLDITGDSFTMSAWVKRSGLNPLRGVITYANAQSHITGIITHNSGNAERFVFRMRNGTSTIYLTCSSIPVNDVWYHVAGVFNGTNIALYLNGTFCDSAKTGSSHDFTGDWLSIGTQRQTASSESWNGTIDEAIIWDRALSALEISDLYQGKLVAGSFISNNITFDKNYNAITVNWDSDTDAGLSCSLLINNSWCEATDNQTFSSYSQTCKLETTGQNKTRFKINFSLSNNIDSINISWTNISCTDSDGDNYFIEGGLCGSIDCNDTNNSIYPGALEICGNGVDEDCSGGDYPCQSCSNLSGDICLATEQCDGTELPDDDPNTFCCDISCTTKTYSKQEIVNVLSKAALGYWKQRGVINRSGEIFYSYSGEQTVLNESNITDRWYESDGGFISRPHIFQESESTKGHPGVGFALVKAYEITQDKFLLRIAKALGDTAVSAQNDLGCGGWWQDMGVIGYDRIPGSPTYGSYMDYGRWMNLFPWGGYPNIQVDYDWGNSGRTMDVRDICSFDGSSQVVGLFMLRLYQATPANDSSKDKYLQSAKWLADEIVSFKDVVDVEKGFKPYGNGGIPQMWPYNTIKFRAGVNSAVNYSYDLADYNYSHNTMVTLNDFAMIDAFFYLVEFWLEARTNPKLNETKYLEAIRLNVNYLMDTFDLNANPDGRGAWSSFHWFNDTTNKSGRPAWGRAMEPPSYDSYSARGDEVLAKWYLYETNTTIKNRIKDTIQKTLLFWKYNASPVNSKPQWVVWLNGTNHSNPYWASYHANYNASNILTWCWWLWYNHDSSVAPLNDLVSATSRYAPYYVRYYGVDALKPGHYQDSGYPQIRSSIGVKISDTLFSNDTLNWFGTVTQNDTLTYRFTLDAERRLEGPNLEGNSARVAQAMNNYNQTTGLISASMITRNSKNYTRISDDIFKTNIIWLAWGINQSSGSLNDSDGDGYNDSIELSQNRDPFDSHSIPGYPQYSTFDGETTEFIFENSTTITNVSNAVLNKEDKGKIQFKQSINFSNLELDSYVFIQDKLIGIDVSNLPKLNVSARLTFYNVSYANPIVYVDDAPCSAPLCTNQAFNSTLQILSVDVTGFSNYTVGDGAEQLSIWDSVEGTTADVNATIWFYANYTNGSIHISGATCNITFNDTISAIMTESTDNYNYSRNFSTAGVYTWNVSCIKTGYVSLNGSDDVNITVAADNPPTITLDQPPANYINSTQQYLNITFNATVTDDYNLVNCSLWHNISGTWSLNQSQNVTGTSNTTEFNLTGLTNTSFIWNIECYDNASNFSFASANRTVTLNWTPADTYPTWSNNATNIVSTYSSTTQSYFNITWQDNTSVSNVYFESNYTGTPTNYSMNNITLTVYNYSAIFPAGGFYWKSYANDSANQWNQTYMWNFTIAKAGGAIKLYINSSETDFKNNVSFAVNISCSLIDPTSGNITIYEDGDVLNTTIGSIATHFKTYSSAGDYNITCSLINSNYTGITNQSWVNATDEIIPNVSLEYPPANYWNDSSDPYAVNFTCSATDNYNLRNISLYLTNKSNQSFSFNSSALITGISNYSNWTISLQNGSYTWNCLVFDEYNNSKWGSNRTILINYTAPPDYPPYWSSNQSNIVSNYSSTTQSLFNITWQDNNNVSFVWFESNFTGTPTNYSMNNITLTVYNYSAIFPAGTYYWKSYANDSANQWNETYMWNFTIDKAGGAIKLYINGSENDFKQNVSFAVNITCSLTTPSTGNITIYEDSSVLNSTIGSTLSYFKTYTSIADHNITCSLLDHQNYTASNQSWVNASDEEKPTTTLNSPQDNYNTSNTTIIFNCSATDNLMLANITLYGNWSSWHANETKNLTGTSNSTTFTKNLTDGTYIWNCLAYDNSSNTDWSSNYTLTIDSISPTINITSPANNSIINNSYFTLSFDVWETNPKTNGFCFYNLSNGTNMRTSGVFDYSDFSWNGTKGTNNTIINTVPNGNYNLTVNCTDMMNQSRQVYHNFSVVDTTQPIITVISSSSSGTTTVTVILSVTTDEAANCRYFTSNISYSNMTAMSTTGNLSHSISNSFTSDTSGTYYVRCNDTAGNVMNYSNSTGYGVDVTEPTDGGTTGGGGGGGGAGAPRAANKTTKFWILIEAGTSAVMAVSEEYIPMTKLTFDVVNTVTNVEVTVVALIQAPETDEVLIRKVYRYLRIIKKNIEDKNISKAVIEFSVDKTWLISNGIKEDDVVLVKYDNGWKELTTKKISSTQNKTTYRAGTSGFSYFAITVKEAIEEPEEVPEEEITPEEEKAPLEEEKEEVPPLEIKPKVIYWQIIILVVLVISFIVVHRFLKREKTKK